MRYAWDAFYFVRPDGPAPPPSLGDNHAIDDWFDDQLGNKVRQLCATYEFDVVLVNYVWMSKALDYVPCGPIKIIDTHDIFANRNALSLAEGIEARWFSTTEQQENLGLNRADLVIAIQDQEEAVFKSRVNAETRVVCLGHLVPKQKLLPKPNQETSITYGFLGSANPFNITSIQKFIKDLRTTEEAVDQSTWMVCLAGSVCQHIEEDSHLKKYGVIEDLNELARDVDIFVNPMQGGTGLKIKTLDFLATGRKVIASDTALVGIISPQDRATISAAMETRNPPHHLQKKESGKNLFEISEAVFDTYSAQVRRAFMGLTQEFYEGQRGE